ncbi:hypothetical protein, partial [Streptobacillus moniliformis]|uniref:hypothetical protein n=1 Tax=Streptobacillus moniliformis TaxID=34105 RepID=UPI0018C8A46F
MKNAIALTLLAGLAALHLLIPYGSLEAARAIDPALATTLLIELRLPSTLLALGYGGTLGICGAALQA